MRKIAVGFLALTVLAGVFLLYLRFNRAPTIVVEVAGASSAKDRVWEPGRSAPGSADGNETDAPQAVGRILDVGIGNVRNTEFLHRDQAGRIDRRFGFHELLHEQGNQWGVTKPFMDLLLPEAVCRVTAEGGTFQVDTALRQPTLTDAVFSGNVVIRIIPSDPNSPWESFIHLDDVGFLAEKSLFSSTGAVRFLSRNVRLTGTGMELIYDMPRSRLERFRVFDLDSLRLRSREIEALAALTGESQDSQRKTEEGTASAAPGPASPDSIAPATDIYRCVFHGNVRLDATDGMAIARDVLSINNIPWPRAKDEKDEPAAEPGAEPNQARPVPAPSPNALNTTASSHLAITAIPEELFDVVVTCDGGFEIGPSRASSEPAEAMDTGSPAEAPAAAASETALPSDRQYVLAQHIDVDVPTGDSTLLGPVAMQVFVDPNDLGGKAGGEPVPMIVTAQQAVRFLAASNQVVLEGDCTATLATAELDIRNEYRLAAPRLVLDLTVDSNVPDVKGRPQVDLRKLVADAGEGLPDAVNRPGNPPVALSLKRRQTPDKLLGWVSLETCELEYVADSGWVTTTGPGDIWLRTNETVESKDDPNERLEPCLVHLANFDTLQYRPSPKYASTGLARIIAEDDSKQLVLDYFPLVDGRPGPLTQVVAGHVEAMLQKVVEGGMDLVSLIASEGIEYDDEAGRVNFAGSELVYDHRLSLITVHGDESRPCQLNGALVDQIEVDRKTGRIKAQFPTASTFELRP